jgi:simple sugar transport system permease protein
MDDLNLTILMASVIAGAAPIVLASLGETLSEKAGVINLSLDGSILLSAMVAFATAYQTQNLVFGFLAGAIAGALIASIVGLFSIYLGQSQVAVGFVLTLTAKDLAYFFGNPFSRLYGPQVDTSNIPWLHKIPFIGTVFFEQSIPVYLSLILIAGCWFYLYRTRWGLSLRAVGENPSAAYARGIPVRKARLWYIIAGGLLIGLAGAAFSLCVKPGWGRPQGAEGTGWIALALVIFGGWHPVRVALGAYLFALLQVLGIHFQGWLPSIPSQVFQVAPFPLMIFVLVLTQSAQAAKRQTTIGGPILDAIRKLFRMLSGAAPAALGKPFRPE